MIRTDRILNSAAVELIASLFWFWLVVSAIGAISFIMFTGVYSFFSWAYLGLSGQIFGISRVSFFLGPWLICGIFCSFYWPFKFRKEIGAKEWKTILPINLVIALSGPIAIVLGAPL